jgi:tagaturonate reductase
LSGVETVKEFMDNSNFKHFLYEVIKKEVIPSIQGDFNENIVYAEEVFERFINPFIHHRLADISLNSLSKFKHRLLPTLKSYVDLDGVLPLGIVQAFAALIRFYKTEKLKGTWTGEDFKGFPYILKDEEYILKFYRDQWLKYQKNQISLLQLVENVLGNKDFWDENLNRIEDLSNLVHKYLAEILKVQ